MNKFVFAILLLISCCSVSFADKGQHEICFVEQKDFCSAIVGTKKTLVVDVREPVERSGELGFVPGSINVPLGQIDIMEAEFDYDTPIILLCRTHNRSVDAYFRLKSLGFENVCVLKNGMIGYQNCQVGVK